MQFLHPPPLNQTPLPLPLPLPQRHQEILLPRLLPVRAALPRRLLLLPASRLRGFPRLSVGFAVAGAGDFVRFGGFVGEGGEAFDAS